jgi:hypothetical protein
MYVGMYVCMYVGMYVCMYECMSYTGHHHAYLLVCMYICMSYTGLDQINTILMENSAPQFFLEELCYMGLTQGVVGGGRLLSIYLSYHD